MPTDDGPEEPPPVAGEITELLRRWRSGDPEALDRLTPLVYGELKRLARAQLYGHREARTLNPTALVNELYVRLLRRSAWQTRIGGTSAGSRHGCCVGAGRPCARALRTEAGRGRRRSPPPWISAAHGPGGGGAARPGPRAPPASGDDAQVARRVEMPCFAGLTSEASAPALACPRRS